MTQRHREISGQSPGSVSTALEPDIYARGVGKKFNIYMNDRDRVLELFSRRVFHEELWALQDLSFTVPRGCAYGIIGSNGAGKSTLLKLLAGVSRPSVGELKLNATISSLLDLGLGFHPNFSGRQNIYLNCTLLGFTRDQIDGLLPQILAFAELGGFIDYPVKTYSSGMSLRLGFAVAAHLEYQIFLIDEVLTVGDQYFQRKCVRKIEDFITQGRTIVLVSHDLHSVRSLCDRVMWLKEGRMVVDGPATEVVDAYMDAVRARDGASMLVRAPEAGGIRRFDVEASMPLERLTQLEEPVPDEDPGQGSDPWDSAPASAPVPAPAPVSREQAEQLGDHRAASSPEALDPSSASPPDALEHPLDGEKAGSPPPADAPAEAAASPPPPAALEPPAALAPAREAVASRFQHAARHTRARHLELPYRATVPEEGLRRRVLRSVALAHPEQLWNPVDVPTPLGEYHGELPLVTGSGEARILEVLFLDSKGQVREQFRTGEEVTIAVTLKALEPIEDPIFGVAIHRNDDVYVYGPNVAFDNCLRGTYHGLYTLFLHYPSLPLLTGTYLFSVALWDKQHLKPYVWHNRLYAVTFQADRDDHGLVVIPHHWGMVTHVAGEHEHLLDPPHPPLRRAKRESGP